MTIPPTKYTEMFKKNLSTEEYKEIASQIEKAVQSFEPDIFVRFIDFRDSVCNPDGHNGWFSIIRINP